MLQNISTESITAHNNNNTLKGTKSFNSIGHQNNAPLKSRHLNTAA